MHLPGQDVEVFDQDEPLLINNLVNAVAKVSLETLGVLDGGVELAQHERRDCSQEAAAFYLVIVRMTLLVLY